MPRRLLLSTAYLPPVEYFSLISLADEILIEREENYLKQSYRNRCYILSAHGLQILTVPVYSGTLHKTGIKDIRIDYSKRWQQVHLRALTASYNSSPYFQYYFNEIEKIISADEAFLLDLNLKLTKIVMKWLKINKDISFTSTFEPPGTGDDYRYKLSPKQQSSYEVKEYIKVFDVENINLQRLTILDIIFNMGPDAGAHLHPHLIP